MVPGRCLNCRGDVKPNAIFSRAPTTKHRAASRELVTDESRRLLSSRWFAVLIGSEVGDGGCDVVVMVGREALTLFFSETNSMPKNVFLVVFCPFGRL